MVNGTLPSLRDTFIILDDPAHDPVPVLLDGRLPVLALARALAHAHLRLRYDVDRSVLVIESLP
jgi:hypothetical protein